MKTEERENSLYATGKRCAIRDEERYMFDLLGPPLEGKAKLLDIGCGSGEISFALREQGFEPFGIDFSPTAIEIATSAGLECQIADLDEGITASAESYDVVWAGDVLEHVFDPIGLLEEISRVLKKSGVFCATIPNDVNLKTRLQILFGQSYQENVYRSYRQFKHHTFFSEQLMRFMYDEAGLKITDMAYMMRIPFTKKQIITKTSIVRMLSHLMIVRAIKA